MQALAGVTIADFSRVLVGPYAMMLAHWFERLSAVSVPCGPSNHVAEAAALATGPGLPPVVHHTAPDRP